MDCQSQFRRSEATLNVHQDELKSSPIRSSNMFQTPAFVKKENSYAASHIMTQLAVVQIIAAQERQRQTVLQLLALQQYQGNLNPHGPRFTSPNSPAQQHGAVTSIEVDGLDLLGAAATLKRSSPRPSIISNASKNDIPRSSNSEHSAETNDGTDTSSFGEDLEESSGKPNRKYIEIIEENDVLCGRGGKSNHHVGNKRYRQVVARMKQAYQSCPAKTLKTDLSRAIVDHCCSYGARFIKLDEASGRYYILNRAEARKKTSQALRESKSLKWTA